MLAAATGAGPGDERSGSVAPLDPLIFGRVDQQHIEHTPTHTYATRYICKLQMGVLV